MMRCGGVIICFACVLMIIRPFNRGRLNDIMRLRIYVDGDDCVDRKGAVGIDMHPKKSVW